MKTVRYKQCRLEKYEGEARIERTIWGEEKYAVEGRIVKVQENDGTWTEGWKVVAASGPALDEKYVRNMSHAYTRQRKASDI